MTKPAPPSDDWSIAFNTWQGRWLILPFAIVIATMIAISIILSLVGVNDLPAPAYSAPSAAAAIIYYVIQLRTVFLNRGKQAHGYRATTGVAPKIKGRNNTVIIQTKTTTTHRQDKP